MPLSNPACRYSFFPDEAEVLLSPNARFFVASEPTLEVLPPPLLPPRFVMSMALG